MQLAIVASLDDVEPVVEVVAGSDAVDSPRERVAKLLSLSSTVSSSVHAPPLPFTSIRRTSLRVESSGCLSKLSMS